MKSDEELKKENPELYRIAREGATEPPHVGKYVHTKDDGMYHCAVCDASLFSSLTKFESNSGWPSFTDPADMEAVTLHEDSSLGMHRTEVRCKNCGAHLGHVFPDGPEKNGKVCGRFCINSVSLNLKEK
jgi:peptide-methionine (R)-S-oxide reductase